MANTEKYFNFESIIQALLHHVTRTLKVSNDTTPDETESASTVPQVNCSAI
jgi:hypothetical protein